jgi:uncharacterized protein with HEPN domain
MKKDIRVFIQDIIESVELIEDYTKGIDQEEFLNKDDNIQMKDAIIRRLEIIGEAVKNIPDDFKEGYPNIPWKQIAGMRDVLIHEYFGVKMERVWKTAKEDLPELKRVISKTLKEIG